MRVKFVYNKSDYGTINTIITLMSLVLISIETENNVHVGIVIEFDKESTKELFVSMIRHLRSKRKILPLLGKDGRYTSTYTIHISRVAILHKSCDMFGVKRDTYVPSQDRPAYVNYKLGFKNTDQEMGFRMHLAREGVDMKEIV